MAKAPRTNKPAAAKGPAADNSKAPATSPAAAAEPTVTPPHQATVTPSQAGASPSEGGGAESHGSQAGDQVDAGAASASGEGASSLQSDAASNDSLSATDTPPADLAAGGDEVGVLNLTDRFPRMFGDVDEDDLEGSSRFPAVIVIVGEHTADLGQIVETTFRLSELSVDEWNGLDPAIRDRMLELSIEGARAMARSAIAIGELAKAAVATPPPADVEISAKSRDGKPFRRCGHLFGAEFVTVTVTADQAEIIRKDPGLTVKA